MSKELTTHPDYSDIYDEAELEEQRLAMLYGTNPTDAARRHGIAEYIEVIPKKGKDKGKAVKIQVKDVLKALPTFFLKVYGKKDPDLTHLNHIADDLADEFENWLLDGKYTERYQAIDTPDTLEWLKIIASMAVSHYIMEHKHRGHALYGKKTFANRDVAVTYTRIKIATSITENAAAGINSTFKHKTDDQLPEELKKVRLEIVNEVDTKVKDILSDNPPPFIEQYRKEHKKLTDDNASLLLESIASVLPKNEENTNEQAVG